MNRCGNKGYRPTMKHSHCEQCGEELPYSKTRFNAKYCGSKCRSGKAKEKYREVNKRPTVTPSTRGAISELKVAIDLLDRGYSVFRSVSPNASCDLIAVKGKKVIRVEVKTGFYSWHEGESGKITHCKANEDNFDVLVIVTHKEIIYSPDVS